MVSLRRGVQGATLLLFFALVCWPAALPGDLFFRLDPLTTGLAALITLTVTASLYFIAGLLLLTALWGRVFCGWACPLGTIIDLLDRIIGARRPRLAAHPRLKQYLLLLLTGAAAGGVLLTWALDPLNWASRIISLLRPSPSGPWLALGLSTLLALGATTLGRRAFCRLLCPLGALLSLVGGRALFRWSISSACSDCGHCETTCRMAAIGEERRDFRRGECIHCHQCEAECPTSAISFPLGEAVTPPGPDMDRRTTLLTMAGAATLATGLRLSPDAPPHPLAARPLRPPGSASEPRFTDLCIRCGCCIRVCPTGTLRPAGGEGLALALETPVLLPRQGGCIYDCNACGEACPTQAIRPLSLLKKRAAHIGEARLDRTRCLPYARKTACLTCHAACPFEAIKLVRGGAKTKWGDPVWLVEVDSKRCTGCGLCEARCPVAGEAAITVAASANIR